MAIKKIREGITRGVEKYYGWKFRYPILSTLIEGAASAYGSALLSQLLLPEPPPIVSVQYKVTIEHPLTFRYAAQLGETETTYRVKNLLDIEKQIEKFVPRKWIGKWRIKGYETIGIEQLKEEMEMAKQLVSVSAGFIGAYVEFVLSWLGIPKILDKIDPAIWNRTTSDKKKDDTELRKGISKELQI